MAAVKKRHEVFISSTSQDLSEAREAISDATIFCGHFPSSMEQFTAGTERDVDIIKEAIASADIFVILVGSRFGSEVQGAEGKHFLEIEYEIAMDHNKPILAFLLNENEYTSNRSSIPLDDHEHNHETDLRKFRERVTKRPDGTGKIPGYFSLSHGTAELVAAYIPALGEVIKRLDGKGGWIRSEVYEDLDRIVTQNPFFKRFIDRLNEFDTLSRRVAENNPHLKKAIANYFLDRYIGRIVEFGFRNFFFESGSSIAFLGEAFIEQFHNKEWLQRIASEISIQTNNILVYLDLLLSAHLRLELYPYGPPEGKYGATMGPLTCIPVREPPTIPVSLSQAARPTVNAISHEIKRRYQRNGLLFCSISGLQLTPNSEFRGPHVSSYYGMLFKRAILEARCPSVIFLDEAKVEKEFVKGKCFGICGPDYMWEEVCERVPLAIAVAAGCEEKGRNILDQLQKNGTFTYEQQKGDDGTFTLIASNKKFADLWTYNNQRRNKRKPAND